MPENNHDRLATRLTLILTKFNSGERLCLDELAKEFNVTTRTMQRDFNRLNYLPIVKRDGCYELESYCLGKLNFKDIKQFATFSGIQSLYPELSDTFIVDLLNARTNKSIEVNGHKYENLSHKVEAFNIIATAIVKQVKICFMYTGKQREVKPYKLVNTNGIWYVVGVEGKILKNFSFSKVSKLQHSDEGFTQNNEVLKNLKEHKGVWFTQNNIEVELEIDTSVAEYFLRRDLLPNQKIVEQNEDILILSTKVAYEEEILKTVRYWIPYITIRSPKYLQDKLEESLHNYLKR